MTSDPQDLTALTPGYFLIGSSILSPPTPNYLNININRMDRWQLEQRLTQHFWQRWCSEYLSRLQQRPKWLNKSRNIEVNNLVLIIDERLPPMKCLMGRVVSIWRRWASQNRYGKNEAY